MSAHHCTCVLLLLLRRRPFVVVLQLAAAGGGESSLLLLFHVCVCVVYASVHGWRRRWAYKPRPPLLLPEQVHTRSDGKGGGMQCVVVRCLSPNTTDIFLHLSLIMRWNFATFPPFSFCQIAALAAAENSLLLLSPSTDLGVKEFPARAAGNICSCIGKKIKLCILETAINCQA